MENDILTEQAKITSKGQITLPKEVREALGVEEGDEVEFVVYEKGPVLVHGAKKAILESALGSWKHLKGSSARWVRQLRSESKKRLKRLGL